ncbi:MAG: GNAT family N-acetyltransferase [Chloroflexota bacterium]|nr:GNAT family N-acetyltransferase [Chloroflexota bacterium]
MGRHPTLIHLPDELRSKRLVLRPYRAEDAEAHFTAVDESRDHLRPWVAWVDTFASIDDARDYYLRCAANWLLRTDLTLGIFEAESGRYLGGAGFHELDWDLRAFEIGYWIRTTASGHGYVSEAVRLLVALAFGHLDARRLELRCDPRNEPSRRVAERVGFVLEGRLRHNSLASDGQPADTLVFALLPQEAAMLLPAWGHDTAGNR